MQPFNMTHALFLALAIMLEILANILLKQSDGFRRRKLGIFSLLCVLGAFAALSQAVRGIDLAVAYALWGGFGILATLIAGWVMYNQRLTPTGWLGILLLLIGMTLIKFA
ncbi:multidrug/spermidine efflux SMR transporter subunit MdtI [Brenneria izadpanahii]|uniref:Spermidine export protein MdtI n=1 Tax=Brenneria izadpanahii TaxID=2722756 RepID=A0ABX7V342_9GAMM|nr:multidrug/spermidine efflux SMR transporter subunit MdtI [Brenneria izadpanahii]QTF10159.1 multidrug/spermidine efflux SMR transporter subunit MdtI [Brenneria izadpanahii]